MQLTVIILVSSTKPSSTSSFNHVFILSIRNMPGYCSFLELTLVFDDYVWYFLFTLNWVGYLVNTTLSAISSYSGQFVLSVQSWCKPPCYLQDVFVGCRMKILSTLDSCRIPQLLAFNSWFGFWTITGLSLKARIFVYIVSKSVSLILCYLDQALSTGVPTDKCFRCKPKWVLLKLETHVIFHV